MPEKNDVFQLTGIPGYAGNGYGYYGDQSQEDFLTEFNSSMGEFGVQIDPSRELPSSVRATISGQPEKNVLATLREKFPWAEKVEGKGYLFQDEDGTIGFTDRKGLGKGSLMGDLADMAKPGIEIAGPTAMGILSAPSELVPGKKQIKKGIIKKGGEILGRMGLSGLLESSASEGYTDLMEKVGGLQDVRTPEETVYDRAATSVSAALGTGLGDVVSGGARAFLKKMGRGGGNAEMAEELMNTLGVEPRTVGMGTGGKNMAAISKNHPQYKKVMKQYEQDLGRAPFMEGLGPDALPAEFDAATAEFGGDAMKSGLEASEQAFQDWVGSAYDDFHRLVPEDTLVSTRYVREAADQLSRSPAPGTRQYAQRITKNLDALEEAGIEPTFENMKELRTSYGKEMAQLGDNAKVSEDATKRIYAAASRDLEEVIPEGEALDAWRKANTRNTERRASDELRKNFISAPDSAAAFKSFESAVKSEKAPTVRAILEKMPEDQATAVRQSYLSRLGRRQDQNFDMTKWAGDLKKLAPDMKRLLIPDAGDLKAFNEAAGTIEKLTELMPKGTGSSSIAKGFSSGGIGLLIASNPKLALAAGAGVALEKMGSSGAARLSMRPSFVKWALSPTELVPKGGFKSIEAWHDASMKIPSILIAQSQAWPEEDRQALGEFLAEYVPFLKEAGVNMETNQRMLEGKPLFPENRGIIQK